MPNVTALRSHIDHIVVTAPTLNTGMAYVRDVLGVTPQAGGEHPHMGTHNCLLRLGAAVYLEVIAINPDAARPDRPRWFQLDRENLHAAPQVATWICRTNDIRAATVASPVSLGIVEAMSRGSLNWRITVPADGGLPLGGVAPMLIEWTSGPHPASTLQDLGCALVGLEGFHQQTTIIADMLKTIGFQDEFPVTPIALGERPHLVALIESPAGLCKLGIG